jgi:hypothetical protein
VVAALNDDVQYNGERILMRQTWSTGSLKWLWMGNPKNFVTSGMAQTWLCLDTASALRSLKHVHAILAHVLSTASLSGMTGDLVRLHVDPGVNTASLNW